MIDTRLAERYRLESEIASGGMATVWLATDQVLGRKVAVKVLHSHLADDETLRERFRGEALAAARLTHTNIVSIYDTGEYERCPFIVMEYLAGGTLRNLLSDRGPLDPVRAAAIGADVSSALAYAHAAGIFHRDVKPANIMFSETGHLKVVDFGIAKAAFLKSDLTTTGMILGTLRYMAPEQVQGADPDGRGDIYSLGIVLYECLTGRPPFAGETELASALARLEKPSARPRDLRPEVPRELDSVVTRALARAPDDRFPDAAEMGGLLRAIAESDATRAEEDEPPTTAMRLPDAETSFIKSEGRWLLPIVLLLALALGLVLGLGALEISGRVNIIEGIGSRPPAAEEEASAVEIKGGGTFDPPPGDNEEHDELVARAFDGNPGTIWRTEGYTRPDLGGTKDGVGLWIDLGRPAPLTAIRVTSVTPGWSGTVRFSDDGKTWSSPGPSETVGKVHDFDVAAARSHRYWMVWVTNLVTTEGQGSAANPYSVGIADVVAVR